MAPSGRPIIAVGYNYNVGRLLHFIATSDAGIKKSDTPYLSKYTEPFYDVDICPVAHPLTIFKFFVYVNEVEDQNKSR